jgi:hypothetical protein
MGESFPNWETFSSEKDWAMSGVHTGPGATQLTRMPRSMSSWAKPLVNATIAPLLAA